MFERFTDRARRVVVQSQKEARLLRHGHIGTEHLLLGLMEESDGVAAHVLASFGFTLEELRGTVREKKGEGSAPVSGHIPFTPRAKKVMEMSLRESKQLGHNHIGTEHLLLGIVREGDGVAAQILKTRADLYTVRAGILGAMGSTAVAAGVSTQHIQERLTSRHAQVVLEPNDPRDIVHALNVILQRLDAIDQRLERLEGKSEPPAATA